ncbi:hypothetical protein Cantr_05732 [Candida viswanathii]|uniref:Uncharacterized protein n=1 Tax=Candida viswanathii TaxID=5486 RepID=A0A367XRR3_9ASCO|nr:hypothetical protein Cantr_05732 [Candida viswanathii]
MYHLVHHYNTGLKMTLTKYQRGDLIEGWNDCPVPQKKTIALHADPSRDTTVQNVTDVLNKIFTLDLNLPERELTHYKAKLVSSVEKMAPGSSHLSFIYHIFQEILENVESVTPKLKNDLKNQVVEYMMVHEGVSSWCSPLKKIVVNI